MTVEDLNNALHALTLPDDFPDVSTPLKLVRALEAHAEHHPLCPEIWRACRLAYDFVHCADDLPPIIGTVRLEHLVRWTDWSVSFDGSDIHTGEDVRIRTVRSYVRTQVFSSAIAAGNGGLASRRTHTGCIFRWGMVRDGGRSSRSPIGRQSAPIHRKNALFGVSGS